MVDNHFQHPRLAAIYDALDPIRSDLEVYVEIVHELRAHRVLDVGCGTGTFGLLLADHGLDVTTVDPAGGSLDVAQTKAGAERVRWIHGDATFLPPMQVDAATMTANVAQAIVDPAGWEGTLRPFIVPGRSAAVRPPTAPLRSLASATSRAGSNYRHRLALGELPFDIGVKRTAQLR